MTTAELIEKLERADVRPFGDHYFVCGNGDVWSVSSGTPKLLRPSTNKAGYFRLTLRIGGKVRHCRLNRVVAEAFYGPPPAPSSVARHLDDRKENNCAENIRWGSISDNARDAVRNGVSPSPRNGKTGSIKQRGEKGNSAKMTVSDVRSIFKMRMNGATLQQIADEFGIDQSNVGHILKGRSWAVPELEDLRAALRAKEADNG